MKQNISIIIIVIKFKYRRTCAVRSRLSVDLNCKIHRTEAALDAMIAQYVYKYVYMYMYRIDMYVCACMSQIWHGGIAIWTIVSEIFM